MLRRLDSLFGPGAAQRGGSLLALIISDYVAYYGPQTRVRKRWGIGVGFRAESPRKLALMFIPRLINNPSLHATVLLRLASRGPRFMLGFWRTVLIAKHSIDISRNMEIGPGLVLPRPVGIGLGASVRIGTNVTIFHYVGLGGTFFVTEAYRPWEPGAQMAPVIGDDVVVFMDSVIVGGINVGDGAIVGAGAWVDRDVPPKTAHPGRAALFRRLADSRSNADAAEYESARH
jgi:serine acetyltransferase